MKKLFLLLVAFSVTPIHAGDYNFQNVGTGCIAAVVITGITSYLGYKYFTTPTNNTPQQQDNISNEINTNKNEAIDNPITPSNNPRESDPQSINHSIKQNNSIIENLIDQKQHNKEPETNQDIQNFFNDNQPKNAPKEKPDLKEIIIKPKTKPNNIRPNKYITEEYLNIISDY